MDLLIGLDVGTSAVKGVLITADGRQVARGKRITEFLYPQTGYVEIDPEAHYRLVCDVISELAAKAGAGDRVRALSMAAASGNLLLLDDQQKPLTNVISWLDTRCVGKTSEILPGYSTDSVHSIVGWPYNESFPFSQLAWYRRYFPDLYRRVGHFGMFTDYLFFRFTDRWGMDHSTGTTFFLQDQVSLRWHRPFLDFFEINESCLSELGPSGSVLGPLTGQGAEDTGLSTDTLVVLGTFDHPGAARATGTLTPGDLLLSCGTSWVGFYPVENRDVALSQNLLIDPFLHPKGPWATMFSLPKIGVNFDWYIKNLILAPGKDVNKKYELFNKLAEKAVPGAGGLYINPFEEISGQWDRISALRNDHTRKQIARAVMEGAAFEMRWKIEQLAKAGIRAERINMVGGPAESPIWPCIVAEVTGLILSLVNGQTAGAVGASALAGIGAGLYKDEQEAFAAVQGEGETISPSESAVKAYASLYEEYLTEVKK